MTLKSILSHIVKTSVALVLTFSVVTSYASQTIKPNEQQFINEFSKQYGIPKQQVSHIIQQIHYKPDIIKKITTPYESLSWQQYRKHFITSSRIKGGNAYLTERNQLLTQAYNQYGVDPDTITAILGVETFYGKNTGSYNVLDALGTLAFYYPPREKFFQKELQQYILLSINNDLPIDKLKGSYAGALGIPQFMPSSYNHYAVDASDNQQSINLFNNHADAIMSVANYLKEAGWQRDQPVACHFSTQKPLPKQLISTSGKSKQTLAWYRQHNINPACSAKLNTNTKAALLNLGTEAKPNYWMVFNNFSAIMRYNPRINYAMAVYQLSTAFKAEHNHG